jgi:protein regulator of cytokinesis 1
LFAALSETLHNQVRLVSAEKNEMTEEAHRIITTIKQMEASLDDTKSRHEYEAEDENLKIFYPLTRCLQGLKEKHLQVSKIHKERFEQVKSKSKELSPEDLNGRFQSVDCSNVLSDFYRTCPSS